MSAESMSIETHTWEVPLLALSFENRSTNADKITSFAPDLLTAAYAYCETLTSVHSRSFYLASALLPSAERKAARALYAFCRVSDDIVDTPGEGKEEKLLEWRRRTSGTDAIGDDLVAMAWIDTRQKFEIPSLYAEQLLDGIATDLTKTRYATFGELATYSYGVASTVGLMAMHIVGFQDNDAILYAIRLGVALQLTNILRDIGEDWQNGRLYLPQDEMAAFGLCEDDVERGIVDNRWRSFMRFQIERNRRLYAESMCGIGMLDRSGRLAIAAAAEFYRAILDDIEAHDYDTFSRRAHVGHWSKLRKIPGIWWRCRRLAWPSAEETMIGGLHAPISG